MYSESNNQPDHTTRVSRRLQWKPESRGDAVVGTLIRTEEVNVNGERKRAAIIREKDGCEWSVLLSYTVLEAKWNQLNPRPGMHVEIKYLGHRKSSSGNPYKLFQLTVSL